MDIENGLATHFSDHERAAVSLRPDEAEAGIPIEEFEARVMAKHDDVAKMLNAVDQGRSEIVTAVARDPVPFFEQLTCLKGLSAQLAVYHMLENPAKN